MAIIDCTIDTEPMARELNSVGRHVNATTTAVVAMQTAVIAAEAKAADHVCKNVNKGFYSLIMSQLSQKVAKLQSEIDSHLMQLRRYKKQLLAIQQRMGRDYNMISERYLKLFNGLNTNLKHRVLELDRPAFDFAVKELDQISNRSLYLTSTVPVSQKESLVLSQRIIVSNMKSRGNRLIDSMRSFLLDMNEQNALNRRILLSGRRKPQDAGVSIPIIIAESNFDATHKSYEVFVNNTQLGRDAQMAIRQAVDNNLGGFQWGGSSAGAKEVENEFNKMLAKSDANQRVKAMMSKLFGAATYQSLKETKS